MESVLIPSTGHGTEFLRVILKILRRVKYGHRHVWPFSFHIYALPCMDNLLYNRRVANGQKKRKRDIPEKRSWYEDLAVETKQSVWAVIAFAVALLLLLAWLGKAGLIGNSAYT